MRGGNRTVEVRVPVLSYDQFGGIWCEEVAVAKLQIPSGAKLPEFVVTPGGQVSVAEVARAAAAHPAEAVAGASTEMNFTPVFHGKVECFGPDGVLKWTETFTTTAGAGVAPPAPAEFQVTGVDDGGH